jgi:hypothetical protein
MFLGFLYKLFRGAFTFLWRGHAHAGCRRLSLCSFACTLDTTENDEDPIKCRLCLENTMDYHPNQPPPCCGCSYGVSLMGLVFTKCRALDPNGASATPSPSTRSLSGHTGYCISSRISHRCDAFESLSLCFLLFRAKRATTENFSTLLIHLKFVSC